MGLVALTRSDIERCDPRPPAPAVHFFGKFQPLPTSKESREYLGFLIRSVTPVG
jgi:hypothetical protein